MRDYQLVSGDSHIEAPPHVWTHRLPAHLRDKGPRVVRLPDGGDGWTIGDSPPSRGISLILTGGLKFRDIRKSGVAWDETLPGAGRGPQRIAEQDRDGVDGEVLFCSVAGAISRQVKDRELVVECLKAYNDWLFEEFNACAPDRLFGLPVIPATCVDDAVAELERVAKKFTAFRAVQILRFPSGGANLTDADEPFWAAAEGLGVTIAGHHNFGGEDLPRPMLDGAEALNMFSRLLTCDLEVPVLPIQTVLQLMLGGVLDRHPALRFSFAETHIGWLPFWLEQMDDRYDRHHFWIDVELPRRPSQYVRDQFTFTFMEDHVGVDLRDRIGVDTICWANDFPHPVGDWPWSTEVVARELRGVPDYERRKIQALNTLEWIRVITPEQKEQLARQPVIEKAPAEVPARGARRLA